MPLFTSDQREQLLRQIAAVLKDDGGIEGVVLLGPWSPVRAVGRMSMSKL